MSARKRRKGESFKEYRANLRKEAAWARGRLLGPWLWISSYTAPDGTTVTRTYRKGTK